MTCLKILCFLQKKYGRVSLSDLSFYSSAWVGRWLPPRFWLGSLHRLKANPRFFAKFGYLPPFPDGDSYSRSDFYFMDFNNPRIKYGEAVKLEQVCYRNIQNISTRFYEVTRNGQFCGVFNENSFHHTARREYVDSFPRLLFCSLDDKPEDSEIEDVDSQAENEAAAMKQMQKYAGQTVVPKFFAKNNKGLDPELLGPPTEADLIQLSRSIVKLLDKVDH